MSWKDRANPAAGGAELLSDAIMERLARAGHTVTLLTSNFPGGAREEVVRGYNVRRMGSRYTVYSAVYQYYRTHLRNSADLIIDEMNTVPFFASFYARKPVYLFVHQLAREIWFYEMPFPLSLAGYLAEPAYLWALRKTPAITVSSSSARDLARYGFRELSLVSEGIELAPVRSLAEIKKAPQPTLLSLGSLRPMKRALDIVHAFELAKRELPALTLVVAGDGEGSYAARVKRAMRDSPHADAIRYEGRVSAERKRALMREAHAIAVASVKEGWCMAVTEAASQGTPAAVYDVDGLRDSVKDGVTGILAKENSPQGLARAIVELFRRSAYAELQERAWEWSRSITFDRSYHDFMSVVQKNA